MEVFSGFPNQPAGSVSQQNRKMGASRGRSEKNAIRVCGDWSEQLSSKGKIYFYNCITEVSQWQKPPEWKLPDMHPDELLAILANRTGNTDGKNAKRPRPSTISNSNHVKGGVDGCNESPKRMKLAPSVSDNGSHSSRTSIELHTDGHTKSRNSRTSPSQRHQQNGPQFLPPVSAKRAPNHTFPHNMPADDMEISPNSSPLSNSSSPNTNLSPCFSKCTNSDPHGTQQDISDESSQKDSSGTLRQLVDAIRASIGGLLEPPSSNDLTVNNTSATTSRCSASHSRYTTDLTFPNLPPPAQNKYRVQSGSNEHTTGVHARNNSIECLSKAVLEASHSKTPLNSSINRTSPSLSVTTKDRSPSARTASNLVPNSSRGSVIPPVAQNSSPYTCSPSASSGRRPSSRRDYSFEQPLNSHLNTADQNSHHSNEQQSRSASSNCNTEHRRSFQNDAFRSPSRPDRTIFRGEIPSHELPSPRHSADVPPRRRGSELEFFNQFSSAVPFGFLESVRARHPSGSQDGSEQSTRTNGLCPSPYTETGIPRLPPMIRSSLRPAPLRENCPSPGSPSRHPANSQSRSNEQRSPETEPFWAPVLSSPITASFLDPSIASKFTDRSLEKLELEADQESRKFEKLQSVLYGELCVESKKLRALVRISEAKLAVHQEKQTAMEELIDSIENMRYSRNLSFCEDTLE